MSKLGRKCGEVNNAFERRNFEQKKKKISKKKQISPFLMYNKVIEEESIRSFSHKWCSEHYLMAGKETENNSVSIIYSK